MAVNAQPEMGRIERPQPRRQPPPVGALTRWLLPTLSSLCLLILLYLLCQSSFRFLNDSDTGWHIRAGDLMRQTRAVIRHDPFSYTMAGRDWFAWEWLSDVLMSVLHAHFGLAGVVVASIGLLLSSYVLLFHLMRWRGADPFVACVLTIFAALASVVHWLARPHLFSILLMVGWCACLEAFRRTRSRWIYALPLLALVWANLHGAFVIIFPMLAIYAAGEALESVTGGNAERPGLRSSLRVYLLVGLASALATLVTPFGWRLYTHIWRYLTDSQLIAAIQEFHSPSFHTLDGKLIEVLLLLGAVAGYHALRRRRIVEVLLLGCWSHLMLKSERHVTLAVIVMTPIIAEHLSGLLREAFPAAGQPASGRRARFLRGARNWYRGILLIDGQLTGALVYVIVLLFLIAALAQSGWSGGPAQTNRWTRQWLVAQFNPRTFPVAAADFIERSLADPQSLVGRQLQGRLYAHDQFGGYLIYRFNARVKVFVDGRSDFYRTGPTLKDFERIVSLTPSAGELLRQYNVQWMVLRADEPLAQWAHAGSEWSSVYRDATAEVLIKAPGRSDVHATDVR